MPSFGARGPGTVSTPRQGPHGPQRHHFAPLLHRLWHSWVSAAHCPQHTPAAGGISPGMEGSERFCAPPQPGDILEGL